MMRSLQKSALVGLSAAALAAGDAGMGQAQTAKDIVGTWTLGGVVLEQGGQKRTPFGPTPRGLAVLDGSRISIIISSGAAPKFTSNNRETGTAEENKAAMAGSIAFFGAYSYDETGKVLSVKIDASNFPNWEGSEQKRSITLSGDTMIFSNPTPSAGGPGGVAKITWIRAK